MVEFGNQIQGVQGDEPGEAVMLDSSGQIPSSGGGMKWTRVTLGTALTAGKVYKIIGPYGSSEFVKNTGTNVVYFPYYVDVQNVNTSVWGKYGCRAKIGVSGNIEYGTVAYSGTGSSNWSTVQSTDENTALYILED